jgi:hypothetical protein
LAALNLCWVYAGCDANREETAPQNRAPTPSPVPVLSPTETRSSIAPQNTILTAGQTIIFSTANGFDDLVPLENVSVTRTADGLRIHALTNDPSLRLSHLKVPTGAGIIVHIRIASSTATNLQVFYNYSTNRDFDEDHSVRKAIRKGDNDVAVEIADPDFKDSLRLDPGDVAGDYLLTLLEVRAAAPNPNSISSSPTP